MQLNLSFLRLQYSLTGPIDLLIDWFHLFIDCIALITFCYYLPNNFLRLASIDAEEKKFSIFIFWEFWIFEFGGKWRKQGCARTLFHFIINLILWIHTIGWILEYIYLVSFFFSLTFHFTILLAYIHLGRSLF